MAKIYKYLYRKVTSYLIYWECPDCHEKNSNCWDIDENENIDDFEYANYCDNCGREFKATTKNAKFEEDES